MAKVRITWFDDGVYSCEVDMSESDAKSYIGRSHLGLIEYCNRIEKELKALRASSERKRYDKELKNKPADRTKWPK